MTIDIIKTEQKRFLSLLEIVRREGDLLLKTDARLFKVNLDAAWVERLENEEDLAERLDAFVSRFGRMQDTLGDKLIPSLLRSLAEKPGSVLDNLNRAEKLGLLTSVVEWLDVRNLRNKLIHEYMSDAAEFAIALNQAHVEVTLLVATYNAINLFAHSRISSPAWPNLLPVH
jgi:phytoene dehydrogenase-like protein